MSSMTGCEGRVTRCVVNTILMWYQLLLMTIIAVYVHQITEFERDLRGWQVTYPWIPQERDLRDCVGRHNHNSLIPSSVLAILKISQAFSIDVVGKDTKIIIHSKVPALLVWKFPERFAFVTARTAENNGYFHSYTTWSSYLGNDDKHLLSPCIYDI